MKNFSKLLTIAIVATTAAMVISFFRVQVELTRLSEKVLKLENKPQDIETLAEKVAQLEELLGVLGKQTLPSAPNEKEFIE